MVQPLHLQDNLSKIPILQKIHETVRAVPEAERDQFAQQLSQEVKNNSQKTPEAKEAEKNRIREQQKKNEEKRKKKRQQLLNQGEAQSDQVDDQDDHDPGRLIDITI